MSLSKEAIQHLQDDSNLKYINTNELQYLAVVATENNQKLQSIEHLLGCRTRFRGNFATHSLLSFSKMVNTKAQGQEDKTPVFIDNEKMAAKAIFNMGDEEEPGHCDNTATLQLQKTPEYESFLQSTDRFLSQDELYYFLLDWRELITVDGNSDEQAVKKAIVAMRDIRVTTATESKTVQGDYANEASAFAKAEASTGGAKPPSCITFNIRPYQNLDEYNLETSVIIDFANPQNPKIKLRPIGLIKTQNQIAEDFKALLIDALKENAINYIGTFTP